MRERTLASRPGGIPIKLATKLIALIVAAIAAMLVLDGYFEIRRERRLVQRDMGEYAQLVGRSLRGPIAAIWAERGIERALELIDDVNRGESDVAVRWVWLDASEPDSFAPRSGGHVLDGVGKHGVSLVVEGEDNGSFLNSYVAVDVPGDRPGALELSESLWKRDARAATRIERLSILLGGLLAASAVTILYLGVRLVGRPLGLLAAKVEAVGTGDLSGPLELRGAGELGDLARGLNRMCDDLLAAQEHVKAETEQKIEALDQLRHADRLRTVGRLASGIAHELGTPLNVVSGRATLIERGTLGPDHVGESAAIIRTQAERMTQIIRQLLDFARRRAAEKRAFSVDRVVAATCELIAPTARKQGVALETVVDDREPHSAVGNEPEIQQVLSNLLMNAVQSMPQGGGVRIEVARDRLSPHRPGGGAPESFVRVTVRDAGEGITEADLPHVFEPFFTTKDVGSGTGLGLSIVYGIIEDHQGWIRVESEPGQGSCFTFYLPEGQS